MAISITKARSLCSKAELDLVMASSRKNLSGHSVARLKQKIALARKLRDKWMDQGEQQRRATQAAQQARGTSANARSNEKTELFAEVLGRFEQQLAKLEGAGTPAAGGAPKRRTPPRKVRAAGHRESRAATREALQTEQEAIVRNRAARPTAPEAPAAKPPAAGKPTVKRASKKATAKKKAVTKASKAVVARKKNAAVRPTEAQGSLADAPKPAAIKKKTIRAKAVAKRAGVVQSGAVRIQKHISARGRRNQSRRDSRG